ncbi:LysR substrate-binding domain-containing protein [Olivibacter ginsenosidimutans]|uniref:LysR substrate-binding domain-containing protein n=1 Tax=Olivibacter ginsenosidimutans TaxID=1176537 RepID=A0ABP9CDY2_9SPHI
MELRHLLYFKTVAELLHFSKAAERLHISQPPLTRQIKELEQELGVQLFYRNNRRVRLTEAGAYFFKSCESLIGQLERSKQLVKQIHDSVSGEFRIGYISSTSLIALAKILQKLQDEYPLLKTRLYELSTIKQVKALEEGKLDVGILRAPIASTQLEITSLWQDKFALVCSAEKPLALGIDDFIQAHFISYNRHYAPHYHQQFIACCRRIGFEPQVVHECNNMHSILSLVENNLGIALVPASIKGQYPSLHLKFTDLEDIPVYTEIVMAHHHHTEHPALDSFKSGFKALSARL